MMLLDLSSSLKTAIFSPQVFANEVNAHRDQIIELDQTGNQLKFLSQKQDVVLIKNLLVSVQSRWEKVVQRSIERGRSLDDARKRAKQVSCKRKIPVYWTTLGFVCWVQMKVLCGVHVHSCYNLSFNNFSSMKLGKSWLIGWKMRKVTWTQNWRYPTTQTKLNFSSPNIRYLGSLFFIPELGIHWRL